MLAAKLVHDLERRAMWSESTAYLANTRPSGALRRIFLMSGSLAGRSVCKKDGPQAVEGVVSAIRAMLYLFEAILRCCALARMNPQPHGRCSAQMYAQRDDLSGWLQHERARSEQIDAHGDCAEWHSHSGTFTRIGIQKGLRSLALYSPPAFPNTPPHLSNSIQKEHNVFARRGRSI